METIKSSRSWIVEPAPSGVIKLRTLKPNIHGNEVINIIIPFIKTAFFLSQFHKSLQNARIFSNTAVRVDKAAKLIKIKNSVPHSLPAAILLNMFGKVTNTSPGPEPGSTLNAKHAGKITNPH